MAYQKQEERNNVFLERDRNPVINQENEVIVFEQNIRDEFENNSMYIRLSAREGKAVGILNFRIHSINVIERMNNGGPVVSIAFEDAFGDLFNHNILEGDFEFFLMVSKTPNDIRFYELVFSKNEMMNMTPGDSSDYLTKVHFVTKNWFDLYGKNHNRCWRNKRYSDVVEDIAKECGFDRISITKTKEKFDKIIQPNWTNLDMLNWIRRHALAFDDKQRGPFYFGSTVDNGFFFHSTGSLINKKKTNVQRKDIDSEIPFFKLRREDRDTATENSNLREILVFANEYQQPYVNNVIKGASGVSSAYYDFMNKEYVKNPVVYSDSNEPQLSEHAYLSSVHEDTSKVSFGGRDTRHGDLVTNQVATRLQGTQNLSLKTHENPDVFLGDIVEYIIPLRNENYNVLFNDYFSGFYFIKGKNIAINVSNSTFINTFELSRQGVNSDRVSDLVSSQRGKVRIE